MKTTNVRSGVYRNTSNIYIIDKLSETTIQYTQINVMSDMDISVKLAPVSVYFETLKKYRLS